MGLRRRGGVFRRRLRGHRHDQPVASAAPFEKPAPKSRETQSLNLPKIRNSVQDRSAPAWVKVCEYIDRLAKAGTDEFAPLEYLGPELFSQLVELPESIAALKKVRRIWLYGSQLHRLPPEIGEMESLEYFDPYTSYHLRWFPYEITRCSRLKGSRVSTRALFGNPKNKKPFPALQQNPVRYQTALKCSVCRSPLDYQTTKQLWITRRVATDNLPLLANVCSLACEEQLCQPVEGYLSDPHKGGTYKHLPKGPR